MENFDRVNGPLQTDAYKYEYNKMSVETITMDGLMNWLLLNVKWAVWQPMGSFVIATS
jgi:hypothetical protein